MKIRCFTEVCDYCTVVGTAPAGSSRIIAFFEGRGSDARGRTFNEIILWDDAELEHVHDFIQWLFPLDTRSGVNPHAPLVDRSVRDSFAASPRLRETLGRAFDRMLAFYGLARAGERIVRAASFHKRADIWLHPMHHNHLRLSRILRSLALLGRASDANALLDCLLAIRNDYPDRITNATVSYWKRAPRV